VSNLSWNDINLENTTALEEESEDRIDDLTKVHDSYYLKLLPSDILTALTEYQSLICSAPKDVCVGGENVKIPDAFFKLLQKKNVLHYCSGNFMV